MLFLSKVALTEGEPCSGRVSIVSLLSREAECAIRFSKNAQLSEALTLT
jgi:hypothetical protein